MYKNVKGSLKIGSTMSDLFRVTKELRQVCSYLSLTIVETIYSRNSNKLEEKVHENGNRDRELLIKKYRIPAYVIIC